MNPSQQVMERCDLLASCSDEPGSITRPFASDAMRRAQQYVREWMRQAGMTVSRDNIGNLRGRYEGSGGATLLLGSHIDSVRDAGKYDGPLGVVIAIAAVQRAHDSSKRLPFALEVLAFADEEGLRYGSTYLGSRAVAGAFDLSDLERSDADGVVMADAIRASGGDPSNIAEDRWNGGDVLGYLEVHIEQGPVLEARGLPVGVVSAIAGQSRIDVTFSGAAAHAGTVPMELRRDALCAAAEFVLAVESLARSRPGLVATVGQIAAEPGASNVIPGLATLSLDVRHQDDAARDEACRHLHQQVAEIGERRGIATDWRPVQEHRVVPCAPRLTRPFEEAIAAQGYPVVALPSGAGHDAAVLAALTGVAMLFVRCRGGISHHPDQSVTAEGLDLPLAGLRRVLSLV